MMEISNKRMGGVVDPETQNTGEARHYNWANSLPKRHLPTSVLTVQHGRGPMRSAAPNPHPKPIMLPRSDTTQNLSSKALAL